MAKQSVSDGQRQEVTPAEVDVSGMDQAAEPFFSFKYLDGDEKVFGTRDDLTEGFRKSYIRDKESSRQRSQWEGEKSDLQKKMDSLQSEREHDRAVSREILEYDRILKSDPVKYEQVKSILDSEGGLGMNGRVTPGQVDDSVYERLEALQKEVADMKSTSVHESAWSNQAKMWQNFDRAATDELVAQLADGDPEKVIEIAHHANLGYSLGSKNSPSSEDVERTSELGKSLADLSPSGGSPVGSGTKSFGSPQEAADAAYKDLGIQI